MIIIFHFLILILMISFLFFYNSTNKKLLWTISILVSGLILIIACLFLVNFNSTHSPFQFTSDLMVFTFKGSNLKFSFGLDAVLVFFFFLSSFISFLCVLLVKKEILSEEYLTGLFLIQLLLLLIFSAFAS